LKLVKKFRPWILCIQETRLATIDEFFYASFWGNTDVVFSYKPSMGASGGILSLWDTSEVEV